MKRPTVSTLEIAIPTYNRAQLLRRQLVRLRDLLPKFPFTITVFDNGSTDETSQVMEEFGEVSQIRWVRAPKNGGISRNIMRCFEETQSDWVWTLSDDNPVREADLETIFSAIRSQEADIYVFKALGNHIHQTRTVRSPAEFLKHEEFIVLAFLSATVYSRRAIDAGLHVLAPGAYSLLPHCLLVFAALQAGCSVHFDTRDLCEKEDGEKRIARLEFAMGCLSCLSFFESDLRRVLARQFRANTRWMLISALAQTGDYFDIVKWRQTTKIVNAHLAHSGGTLWRAFLPGSFHTIVDLRREIILSLILGLPWWMLLWIGKKLADRTGQWKDVALFDCSLSE